MATAAAGDDADLALSWPTDADNEVRVVVYRNQVGGVICWKAEMEGVLGPLDLTDTDVERIMKLPFSPGRGVSVEIADALDAILAANARTRFVQADRARRMADRVTDDLVREKLLEMASEFGRYAALIEEKAREKLALPATA